MKMAKICGRKTDGTDVLEVLGKLSGECLDKALHSCVKWQCKQTDGMFSEEDVVRISEMVECVREYYIEATINQMITWCEESEMSLLCGVIEVDVAVE